MYSHLPSHMHTVYSQVEETSSLGLPNAEVLNTPQPLKDASSNPEADPLYPELPGSDPDTGAVIQREKG